MGSSSERIERGAAIRTFLIADVRGYTRFTAQQGDEAASRLAARFAQIAAEGIEAWGGELVELRGDEALAVFSSARQALRAAVELQSAFADETRADPELPLGVGIGLDAGEAVPVGEGYRGAALNLASRLCSVAAAGEVLASESLVHLTGRMDGLEYTARDPGSLKGYDTPVAAYAVSAAATEELSATVPPDGSPPAAAALPPGLDPIVALVGRDRELLWLRWHWRRASHGHGRAVVLSGSPGIGKTRLAAEIATVAHASGADVAYIPASRLGEDASSGLSIAPARPTLVVVDDLDAASAEAARGLPGRWADLAGAVALLLVTHRREAPPQLMALVERLAPPEQRLTVGPVDADAVRAIVAMYGGRAAAEAPIEELVAESGGVPAAVHRVASQWARGSAARRLGSSADRTATGRRGLRDAEAALADDVADLELAVERERLYASDGDTTGTADPAARASRAICPYKGLAEFEAADADHYFGRERLVAELIARSVGSTFLGLVGDSGSGKSSALRAGLLPALAGGVLPGSDTWPQAVLRPGEQPVAELERALARAFPALTLPADDAPAAMDAALASLAAGQRLVVVVDQFEEVFNATRDAAERSAFIDLLTRERPGLKVVVAMRADHYGRCAAYPALARLLGSAQVLVGPLSGAELAAVIEHPAQRVGLRVEPGLTEALVADAGAEPGVLPLLSTTLLELWGARERGRLTLSSYRASGGLHGSIARLAEATYGSLDPHRQDIARALLLRLAGPGGGTELVRRRVALEELDADGDMVIGEVLATLTAARLLTAGDGHIEVAHEALLREWPRLQGWLADDASGRAVRLHLIGAARDWEARGREPGDLYRGARLAAALDWAAEHQLDINASERSFLDDSRSASEHDAERHRHANRRLRALLTGAAVFLVVAVGAAGFAFLQSQRAEEQRQLADQQRQLADRERQTAVEQRTLGRSRELMASAVAARDQDPSLSKLLALEALKSNDQPTYQSTTVLHEVLSSDPIIARYRWPAGRGGGRGLWTEIAPDGRLTVAGNQTDYIEVMDPRTGSVLWSYPEDATGAGVGAPYFSTDGDQVMVGRTWDADQDQPPSGELGIVLLDAQTGQSVRRIDVGPCGGAITARSQDRLLVRSPEQGPDGLCHWIGDAPTPLVLVDLKAGTVRNLTDQSWSDGTLSGDGRFAAYEIPAGDGTRSVVVDVDTGKAVFEVDPDAVTAAYPTRFGYARGLNNDGSLLLYGDWPMLVYSIEAGSARPIAELSDTAGESGGAVFDPTGQLVVATFRDGSLRTMDAHWGGTISTWPAVGGGLPSIAVDGRTTVVADPATGTAALLDIGARGDVWDVQTCPGFVSSSSLSAEGGLAAFLEGCEGSPTQVAQVVDLKDRTLVESFPGWGRQIVVLSPDGTSFAGQEILGQNLMGPLAVADARTGSVKVELQGLCRWDEGSAHPAKEPGCAAYPTPPFPFWARTIRWSPDGSMIAAVDDNTQMTAVWDARDGRLLHADTDIDGDPYERKVADVLFSPDSGELVEAHPGGVIERLSTETWTRSNTNQLDQSIFGLDSIGLVGYSPDGSSIVAVSAFSADGGASIMWIDPTTLRVTKSVANADMASPKSAALSPDGDWLATGASDGSLRIWDATTGQLQQQMQFASQVQGVAFLDDSHLAVTPQAGDLLITTIDPQELADVVRASITRPFTATECATYGIDPCPTLEQSRAR